MSGVGKPPPSAGWANVAPGQRRCVMCREVKLLSEFLWNSRYGRGRRCAACRAARAEQRKESKTWIASLDL